jgi:uncharacterized protein (DUF3084 family)
MEQLETLVDHPDDQEQAITQWFHKLEATKQARDFKIDNYCALIKELEVRIAARKAEAQRLLNRARVDEKLMQFLKRNLKQFFEQQNLKTVDTRRFKLTH